jgi:hypothetical protein
MAHAYDDLYYLERACMAQVLAQSTGRPLVPVDASIAECVRDQTLSERLQSELFFEALRRSTTPVQPLNDARLRARCGATP